MPTQEKIQLDYLHETTYSNTANNAVGATTSTTLRTVTVHTDANCKYVKKFGTDYAIGDVTNGVLAAARSAGGNAWKWEIWGYVAGTWTLMARVVDSGGASAFTDIAACVATKVKIVLTCTAGTTAAIVNGDTLNLTTDIDAPLAVRLPAETVTAANGRTITLYLSSSGSTYYDADYKYGGYRHTPTGTFKYPYFTITAAEAVLAGAFVIVTVLDNETYDEEIVWDVASTTLQAASGYTPTITNGCGARVTREVAHDGNNYDTVYVSKLGSDAETGTWDYPLLTLTHAETHVAGAIAYINVKDSETYSEVSIVVNQNTVIEPIYGKVPRIVCMGGVSVLSLNTTTAISVHGFILDGNHIPNRVLLISVASWVGSISNNTIINAENGITTSSNVFTGTITKNNIYNMLYYGIYIEFNGAMTGTISKNIIYQCQYGIYFTIHTTGATPTITITNNIIYNITINGIMFEALGGKLATHSGNLRNNIIFNSVNGISIQSGYTMSGEYDYNIFYNATTFGVSSAVNITLDYNCFYLCGSATGGIGAITNNNPITTNPYFINTSTPYNFGLSANSSCFKANGSEADVGVLSPNIIIGASTVIINGFIFDGQSFSNNAIQKTGATDYTTLTVEWCTIKNYQGIAIDDYSGATTTTTITNCIIHNNGNGIKFTYGGNTFTYNIVHRNTRYGLHSDYTGQTINHCDFCYNEYGIYFESNSGSIILKNSIFIGNSLYGVSAEVYIFILYSCIVDLVNSYVTILPAITYFNITDDPLFINTEEGTENYNLKSYSFGYLIDSPCIEAADDGDDMGAYDITRTISGEGWKIYAFTHNPRTVQEGLERRGNIDFDNALGQKDGWGKAHKRSFNFKYGNMQYNEEDDRKKLFYFLSMVPTRESSLTREKSRIRLHFLPSAKEVTGAADTVDADARTLTDTAATWVEDEHKGFYASIYFDSGTAGGTDMNIVAATKIATVAGKAWTVDSWIGYYLHVVISGKVYYFYITDNTADTLTFSDPHGYLASNQSDISWAIVKNHLIESNTETVLTLKDDDDELVDGTYSWHIDFIICKIADNKINYSQPRFFRQMENWKMGSELSLIEE